MSTVNDAALNLVRHLNDRRKELGMSMETVARKSGVGMRTVQRVLSGRDPSAKLDTVLRIADTLGVILLPKDRVAAHDLVRKQAVQKATELAGMVQGTSALEAQAVSKKALLEIRDDIASDLIRGSRRQLWA
jgi:transcriptional regulator with XRE-family HTH domain